MNGIRINKLRIEGDKYRRTLEFKSGLNIISGDIYSGKSLVLRLIDYALGKGEVNLKVQRALDKYCDKIFLEIEIDNKKYTIRRSLKKDKTNFYLYYCQLTSISEYTPRVLKKKDLSIILMDLLEIPIIRLLKNKKQSSDKELETLTIRDIFRFTYIDQHDLGTHNFLKGQKPEARKNKYAFEVIMNFIEEDKKGIKEQIAKINNEINENRRTINGLTQFLKEGEFSDLSKLIQQRNHIDSKIKKLNVKKRLLINNMKNHRVNDNPIYQKLLEDRNNKILEINKIEKNIKENQLELYSRKNLLKSYEKELSDIKATQEANYYFETIKHKMKCPLCKSEVDVVDDNNISEETFVGMYKELEEKIAMIKAMIENLILNIRKMKQEKGYYIDKIGTIGTLLDKYNSNNVENINIINEIEDINKVSSNLKDEFIRYQEAIKIHNKIEEKNQENINKEKRLLGLNTKLDELLTDIKFKNSVLRSINEEYRLLLTNLGYKVDENDTYISSDDYIPYYNGASVYEHDSGGLLVCIQISYLGAIINTFIEHEDFQIKYPNFLMLDTIGKYLGAYKSIYVSDSETVEIMDEETYKDIYDLLSDIGEKTQVIIVDNTPPQEEGKYIRYIFKNETKSREAISESGLIDLSKNEYSVE
ncbi:hypothetical protein [Clostridium sp. ZS1]|uniref:hypothetical protein n=1 Tax=Clostridium sp. ZS1 TaxID=2949989 RepID=UPI001D4884CE|nr:hypothetical protein [Clostridium sp. ZS1]MBN1067593.1 hypothetical protein [Clostridium botulinum]